MDDARELISEACDRCGGDGILNRDLPKEKQVPIWTMVEFYGLDSHLTYFRRRVCNDCNNRWQRLLLDDLKAEEERPKPVMP